jgi:hypothetical protein
MRRIALKGLILAGLIVGLGFASSTSAKADAWCTPWDGTEICIDYGGCCPIPGQCTQQCSYGRDADCHCVNIS